MHLFFHTHPTRKYSFKTEYCWRKCVWKNALKLNQLFSALKFAIWKIEIYMIVFMECLKVITYTLRVLRTPIIIIWPVRVLQRVTTWICFIRTCLTFENGTELVSITNRNCTSLSVQTYAFICFSKVPPPLYAVKRTNKQNWKETYLKIEAQITLLWKFTTWN